jgi:hypothetical protein
MEVLVGLPPLDLVIQVDVSSTAHRLWAWGAGPIFILNKDIVVY